MRLDEVQIKVTFGAESSGEAVQVLGLSSEGVVPWQVCFCEDTAGPGTPLLDNGIVLRARVRPGEAGDVTVKLRPVRRSQLKRRWQTEQGGFTIAADWAGHRRSLAASYHCEVADDVVRPVVAGEQPVESLFTQAQREFLRECGAVPVAFSTLRVLPPVTAVRWTSVPKAPPVLGVRAERWTVDDLGFLELSVLAQTADAEERQEALVEFAESFGLPVDPVQETKTRRVLEHLVPG